MKINDVELIAVSAETRDEIFANGAEMARRDVENVPAVALAIVESTSTPRREAIDFAVGHAPEMDADEERKIRRRAKKLIDKKLDARVRGYVRPTADELSTRAEIDDKLHKLRVDDAARERRAAERAGDLPSLSSQVLDWEALAAQPDARWIVDGVIPERATVIVYGPSGVGKSFVCQSIAASLAGGFDWLGRPVESGAVLYIFAEGGSGAGKRFQALADAWHKGKPIDALRVLPVAPNLTLDADVAELEALNREHDFAAIVYDTLNRVAGDAEENSATAMSGILNAIERIRRAGSRTTSVIVHHSGKNGDQRGSTALWAAADTVLELSGEPAHLKLDARKQKDAPEGVVGYFRLAPSRREDTLILEGVAPGQGQPSGAQAARVEEALAHFVRAFGETGSTVTQFVDVLVDAGMAKKTAAHEYANELIRAGRLVRTSVGRGSRLELAPERTTFPTPTKPSKKSKKEK